jgi:hypothetical protein
LLDVEDGEGVLCAGEVIWQGVYRSVDAAFRYNARMQPELTPSGRLILNFLRADATATKKVSHWDPGWISRELDVPQYEFYVACKQLEALGLVALCDLTTFVPEIVVDQKLSDICITPRGMMGDFQFGRYPNAGISN